MFLCPTLICEPEFQIQAPPTAVFPKGKQKKTNILWPGKPKENIFFISHPLQNLRGKLVCCDKNLSPLSSAPYSPDLLTPFPHINSDKNRKLDWFFCLFLSFRVCVGSRCSFFSPPLHKVFFGRGKWGGWEKGRNRNIRHAAGSEGGERDGRGERVFRKWCEIRRRIFLDQ